MADPFEVYQEAWDNRLNVIRETRPDFIPYDAHNAGLRAVAAAAWAEGTVAAIDAIWDGDGYKVVNPYRESE